MSGTLPNSASSLEDILRFLQDAGADDALDEVARNRFDEAPAPRTGRGEPSPAPQLDGTPAVDAASPQRQWTQPQPIAKPLPTAVPDEAQAALAREAARRAGSLEELREIMAGFDGCNLKLTAKNLVFADGNPKAALMLVGEAPGREEDLEGLPFVGRSGKLLDRMLAAIGLDRGSAYIANVIPWRPPGNRAPTPHETEICRPFIERQIELANPKVMVTLGGPSARVVLNVAEGVLKIRGGWRSHTTASGIAIPAMPTLHPAYLLRTPAHKRLAWRDFLEVKMRLKEARDDTSKA
jgi:uracil-DNA glycosylase family 4